MCLGIPPEMGQEEDMPDLGPGPSYGQIPEMSIYTNHFKDTRDHLVEESIKMVDKRGSEMDSMQGRILNLEMLWTKSGIDGSQKEKEVEESSESSLDNLDLSEELKRLLVLAQKKDSTKWNQLGF